jgi:hypothetical protein
MKLRRDTRAFLFALATVAGTAAVGVLSDLATARLAPQPDVYGPPVPNELREVRGGWLGIRWRAGSAKHDAP